MRRGFEGGSEAPMASAPLAPYAPPSYAVPPMGGFGGGPAPGMALPQLPGKANVPTLMSLLNALKRRWVLAAFLGLLVGLAAATALWIAAPQGKHQVKAILELQPEKGNPIKGGEDNVNVGNHWVFKNTQMKLIRMRSLLAAVVAKNRVERLPMVAQADDKIQLIDNALVTRWEGTDTDLMSVVMNGDKPEEMKVILEELIAAYVNESNDYLRKVRQGQKDVLVKAKDDISKKVDYHREQLREFTRSGGADANIEGITAAVTSYNTMLTQYRSERLTNDKKLSELDAKIRRWKNELDLLKAKQFSTEEIEAALLREKDSSIKVIQEQIEGLQQELKVTRDRATDVENPTVKNALARIESRIQTLRDKRTGMAEERRAEVEAKLRADKGEELDRNLRLGEDDRVAALSNKTLYDNFIKDTEERLQLLQTDATMFAKKYSESIKPMTEEIIELNKRIREMDVLLSAESRIRVREQPVVSMNHNQRQKLIWSTLLGLASFVGVVLLVAYLEWRSRRVDGVDQVVNELGLRIIGTIPAFPTRASIKAGEADANQNWRFILNESVNSTRTMLLHAAKTQQMQVIMITSAIQGEGKTSLSSQLATSMATAGLRTLIVDCDLRNPSMHRLFDIPLAPGCSEVLLGELDVSDGIQTSSVPNLWVLPAGQCSNRVIAALAQGHPIESLFNRLRGQFDFIVVDTCPILPVADALLIGQHVDGVLLSILQDISQLPKVMNAQERLMQLNIPLLGAVVNGIKTDIHAYGYNYVKQLPA